MQNLFHHYGPQQLKGVEWRFRRKKSPQAKNLMKSNKNEIYFLRPGVDFKKVGCTAQIIEMRLHPTHMPNFLKVFYSCKYLAQEAKDQRRAQNSLWNWPLTENFIFLLKNVMQLFVALKVNSILFESTVVRIE